MARPERSDARLPPEEEAAREAEVRGYFDGQAPKRHTKPSRSDYSTVYSDALNPSSADASIPELDKFQELEADPKRLVYDKSEAVEEYVETDYYKDLDGLDEQHHTTGTGFIKMEQSKANDFHISEVSDASSCHESCRGNPATNEWIPATNTVFPASDKPSRSDS